MKIIIVTAATNTIPRFRIEMLESWVDSNADVLVLGDEPESAWGGYFEGRGMRYRSYSVSRNGLNPMADARTLRELKDVFFEEQPDKVFTYQAKPNIYGCLAAHSAGVSEVYVMMGGLGSVFSSDDPKSRCVRAVVSCEYKIALRHAKKVFFQNGEDLSTLKKAGIVRAEQVVMVRGSGVNVERFALAPLPEKLSFLFVGRLVRGKGVFEYLDAARMVKSRHPEVEFHLVGPFDTNPTSLTPEKLQPYIDDGVVAYHGEQKDVRPFLRACSVFVLPSYYGEGTPKAALEAMATGRPLIVADAVGCREVVRQEENGLFVPPKDAGALEEAMVRLIEDPRLVRAMGLASRRFVEERFDVRKVNDVIAVTMGISK